MPQHKTSQALEIPAVTQIRVSDDYGPGQRADQWALGDTALLAHSLGLVPFKVGGCHNFVWWVVLSMGRQLARPTTSISQQKINPTQNTGRLLVHRRAARQPLRPRHPRKQARARSRHRHIERGAGRTRRQDGAGGSGSHPPVLPRGRENPQTLPPLDGPGRRAQPAGVWRGWRAAGDGDGDVRPPAVCVGGWGVLRAPVRFWGVVCLCMMRKAGAAVHSCRYHPTHLLINTLTQRTGSTSSSPPRSTPPTPSSPTTSSPRPPPRAPPAPAIVTSPSLPLSATRGKDRHSRGRQRRQG